MILGFGFSTQKEPIRVMEVSANLLLAYSDMVKKKARNIALFLVIFFLGGTVFYANRIGLSVFAGQAWFVITAAICGASLGISIYWIIWNGPKAIKFYAVITTDGFDEFVERQKELAQRIVSMENITYMHLTYTYVKHVQKTLVSMEILSQIADEFDNFDTFQGQLKLIMENTNLYGFFVKDLTRFVNKVTE